MTDPFALLRTAVPDRSPLRRNITDHTRPAEAPCVEALALEARLSTQESETAGPVARNLVSALRAAKAPGLVQSLVQEYDLSTREGIALMCLAEALLRIPDIATRDALIRDKLSGGNWQSHLGGDSSIFMNAATWGLVVSGRLLSGAERQGLGGALSQLVSRCGEPVIRRGVDMAMRMMGAQFVTGETIAEALKNSRRLGQKGFRYSYDMLGEAATTQADAERYYRDYEQAIHAIGRDSAGLGIYRGDGISVKLSALHPRYSRLQRDRVMEELLPRLLSLASLAARYDIGFNIDAEEADRLELSLDLLEALSFASALSGWNGLGFVVQAYQKRAPFVLDWIIDLARRSGRRMMVRLVKGAYWDSEIKRAQVEGLADFPVYTVKHHTDIAYIACARRLLAAPDAVFPQFATHNAQSLAAIYAIAGADFSEAQYEFQCLHGMGEALYNEVVGPGKLGRPVRVYAPVGTHETLLAYLVRRLLENGANSSFVNRIQDPAVSIDELVAEPAALFPGGFPPTRIPLPPDLYRPERRNAAGMDLTDENTLRVLAEDIDPACAQEETGAVSIGNPADRDDIVGHVAFAAADDADAALSRAARAFPHWRDTSAARRAEILSRAADILESRTYALLPLLIREAGKSFANAVSEIREGVDFLRYYAAGVASGFDDETHHPLGPVVCISPWNFPLAIFLGQISAALAAGNTVVAKPAEETPLIARSVVGILHEAGVPADALQFVAGAGDVGARLVGHPSTRGVLFTGSTEVARAIHAQLSQRCNPDGSPVPLVAETGGQNALVVDSSALAEQVVADTLASAFDSAGQRCSALRILCLQEECAERVVTMLKGAMDELRTGNPARLDTDVGPVISAAARDAILAHIEAMRARGYPVYQAPLAEEAQAGWFVPPTLIEVDSVSALKREVFGPVLHVLRYRRAERRSLMEAINATGYALTFGVHSRIDSTIDVVAGQSQAGNIYVNRNLVGAVVGVQPFGGHHLSGTGPKAGGPLYLRRLLSNAPPCVTCAGASVPPVAHAFSAWWSARHEPLAAPAATPLGMRRVLPGPTGEENVYRLLPRGTVLCAGPHADAFAHQAVAALATGNRVAVPDLLWPHVADLPEDIGGQFVAFQAGSPPDVALISRGGDACCTLAMALSTRAGPIVSVHTERGDGAYPLEWLVLEQVVSTNTTAAGGNAALMAL